MRKESGLQGVPVIGDCKRCCGRGYERIPPTEAHGAICGITDAITWIPGRKALSRSMKRCSANWRLKSRGPMQL